MSTALGENTAVVSEVLSAADAIVDAFGHHRREDYFSGFAADASFQFYTVAERLETLAAYEALWDEWESTAGFRVHSCASTNQRVQLFGSTAVFSHSVETTVEMDGVVETVREQETIVFENREGRWLAVHEHLSPRAE